ncbi:hypothetical protein SK128_027990 [Halocaridina rubra]|uniref:protein-tyrosine-phosphatase n=1 Tax=Halocaridina rubra TaxID=373956 RepID=A0AAN9A1Z1_HALRR
MKPADYSTSISSQNKNLNRYTNVEPYDRTLVKVSHVNYINASYVMNGKFIATQDPWPNQDDDLWQLIWEHNVRIIVRLSNDNKHPTAHYIRDDIGGEWVMGHDEIVVSVKDIQRHASFQKRTITVTKDAHSRVIDHFHMTNWPEGSVPSPDDLYQLVTTARNSHKKHNDGNEGNQPSPYPSHIARIPQL